MLRTSVTFLGTRGTVPVCDKNYIFYGGDTSCVAVRMGDEVLVLDGGTGINRLENWLKPQENHISLLLSHTHVDHIIGLPAAQLLYNSAFKCDIYGAKRDGLSVREQIDCLMNTPLWPVSSQAFSENIVFNDINKQSFNIGKVQVSTKEGNHPGGALLIKLSYNNKNIVYATDYESTKEADDKIADFIQNADLLIIDAQFVPCEKEKHKGFGHSTWQDAAQLGKRCNVKEIRLFHHSPLRTDAQLSEIQAKLNTMYTNVVLAHSGEEIFI
ncbi:MAG: MBL fold metallo-hydrolase [Oscillospiraceae bacterium]